MNRRDSLKSMFLAVLGVFGWKSASASDASDPVQASKRHGFVKVRKSNGAESKIGPLYLKIIFLQECRLGLPPFSCRYSMLTSMAVLMRI